MKRSVRELLSFILFADSPASRIALYQARAAHTNARLLSALDTLDNLRATYIDKMEKTREEVALLQSKVRRYARKVEHAERERDGMQELVEAVLEKAEMSSGLYPWAAPARMQLSTYLDPIQNPTHQSRSRPSSTGDNLNEEDEELLAYAASIIENLRSERDRERRSHQLTRESAEQRIRKLEAQLARREAELEGCLLAAHDHQLLQGGDERDVGGLGARGGGGAQASSSSLRPPRDASRLDQPDPAQVLEVVGRRNRVLEDEIRHLEHRLHEARAAADSISPQIVQPTAGPSRSRQQSMPPEGRNATPVSYSQQQSHLASHGTTTPRPETQTAQKTNALISEMTEQLNQLASNIDAFREERYALSRLINGQDVQEPEIAPDVQEHPALPQPENGRQEQQQTGLLEELEQLRQDKEELSTALEESRRREADLLDQITTLQKSQRPSRPPSPTPPSPPPKPPFHFIPVSSTPLLQPQTSPDILNGSAEPTVIASAPISEVPLPSSTPTTAGDDSRPSSIPPHSSSVPHSSPLPLSSPSPSPSTTPPPPSLSPPRFRSPEIKEPDLETATAQSPPVTPPPPLVRSQELPPLPDQPPSSEFPSEGAVADISQDLLETDEGEMSMELATPLLPISDIPPTSPPPPRPRAPSESDIGSEIEGDIVIDDSEDGLEDEGLGTSDGLSDIEIGDTDTNFVGVSAEGRGLETVAEVDEEGEGDERLSFQEDSRHDDGDDAVHPESIPLPGSPDEPFVEDD
ncbi:hypothetical protein BDN72DRAFT_214319 [Pluteus cervinus]|uniref:Uncharacterized protein n=1 Tax=Pluteus cervinus TaxID=181527 RepID=A0ACD3B8F2_9AGAR|nr:hypothetical protein BDN72DRAFT_214319 [Pluteus cervinus]